METTPDRRLHPVAVNHLGVCGRSEAQEAGFTDHMISHRVDEGAWTRLHPGVYAVGAVPLDWRARLVAAALAAGERAVASHRAAMVVWDLDGISAAPLELTVPIECGPVPEGVIVHRTRRPPEGVVRDGIPVTTVERTILDAASCLPGLVVEKALESALRKNLTSVDQVLAELVLRGGRGVKGTKMLRGILAARPDGRPAGSPAEVEILSYMRRAGVPEPVRQYRIPLADHTVAVVDFGWPRFRKVVEIDGWDAHGGALALDRDLYRQNLILDTGHQIRRYSASRVRRDPKGVVADIARFLAE
ncbi:MAG: hypothetical protein KatS3mg011_0003 [Acidimicrobiia bacterium]|nr:MAG: hypothetical protein KatS3mg011_0003 [Acidimicrobiia bacterium]